MPRHSRAMDSSRARPVLLLDDEDLDIVMEESRNGRLRELYNEPFAALFSLLYEKEQLAKFIIYFSLQRAC